MFILNIFSICLIFNAACVYMEKYICAVKDLYGSETNVHQWGKKYDNIYAAYVHLNWSRVQHVLKHS